MSSSAWEEVKRLAADFQRTQLSESAHRLNDRNCVEIVRKIVQLGLLEVLFTSDGKEYITPDHLLYEIEQEVYANNGRITINDLVTSLQMDIGLLEQKCNELCKQSAGRLTLVLGQLISAEFKDALAIELNERLQTKGCMTISDMVKLHDFPPDFLQGLVNSRLKSIINAVQDPQDPQTYFTQQFFDQYRSKIRGVLNGITRPASLNQLQTHHKFPPKIFASVMADLAKSKEVRGSITLGSQGLFIPEIYQRSQQQFIDNFLQQNSYIDYNSLARIGIADGKSYCKKRGLLLLRTCAIQELLYEQIDGSLQEIMRDDTWIDLGSILPSAFAEDDIVALYELCVERNRSLASTATLINTFVICNKYLDSLQAALSEQLTRNANIDFENGNLSTYVVTRTAASHPGRSDFSKDAQLSRKEERKRQSLGKQKTGGGVQGREVKIKSTKKKYNRKDDFDSDNDDQSSGNTSMQQVHKVAEQSTQLTFITKQQILTVFNEKRAILKDAPEQLINQIADRLLPQLRERYLKLAPDLFNERLSQSCSSKKSHQEVENVLNQLWSKCVMCDRGIQLFQSSDLQSQLQKYLLKSICTELLNTLISYACTEENLMLNTFEARQKCIKKLPSEFCDCFNRANSSLNANSIEEFLSILDELIEKLDFVIKKLDKRREKQLLTEHRACLQAQLRETPDTDASLALHLVVLIMFLSVNGHMLHASGKFVPQILFQLQSKLPDNAYAALSKFGHLVIQKFRRDISDEDKHDIDEQLLSLVGQVKEIALNAK